MNKKKKHTSVYCFDCGLAFFCISAVLYALWSYEYKCGSYGRKISAGSKFD